jgi:hypothetical protein
MPLGGNSGYQALLTGSVYLLQHCQGLASRQFPYFFALGISQIIFCYQFANLLVIGLKCSALGTLGFKLSLLF